MLRSEFGARVPAAAGFLAIRAVLNKHWLRGLTIRSGPIRLGRRQLGLQWFSTRLPHTPYHFELARVGIQGWLTDPHPLVTDFYQPSLLSPTQQLRVELRRLDATVRITADGWEFTGYGR